MTSKESIVLNQLPRGFTCPNASPFAIHWETILRVARIPHKIDSTKPFDAQGRTPWLQINKKEAVDIHDILKENAEQDLDSRLNPEQRALAMMTALMLEDHTFWLAGLDRFLHKKNRDSKSLFPTVNIPANITRDGLQHPMSNFSAKEMDLLLLSDIQGSD